MKRGTIIQVSLTAILIFSLALIVAAGLITYGLTSARFRSHRANEASRSAANGSDQLDGVAPAETPPWGELITYDIRLEQPEEYLAFELENLHVPTWTFEQTTLEKARAILSSCGVAAKEIERAMSPAMATVSGANVVVHPDHELLFSLTPRVRAALYHQLAHSPANQYMRYPFTYSGGAFEECFGGNKLDTATVDLVKKLLYPRGDLQCFSDYEVALQHISSKTERLRFLEALSSQSAVLARLRIRPNTDVDKLLGYWAWPGGARFKDVRPLLDSLKQLPDGGTVSFLYLLPQFARQRLYTFPMPSKPGDPAMDCHWSTLNFFNEIPDDRFNDTSYTAQFLSTNYYQIAKPNQYGDLIFFLDPDNGTAIHSGVYLADDIVFTKNGNNMAQPWMLMRLKDLTAKYQSDGPARMIIYRNKSW